MAAAQTTVSGAETSLRYNVLRWGQQAALAQARLNLETLEHAAIQTRSLTRALYDAVAIPNTTPLPVPLSGAIAALVAALAEAVGRLAEDAEPSTMNMYLAAALAQVTKCRKAIEAGVREAAPVGTPDTWMRIGALLASADRMRADRMRADLARAAGQTSPEDDGAAAAAQE